MHELSMAMQLWLGLWDHTFVKKSLEDYDCNKEVGMFWKRIIEIILLSQVLGQALIYFKYSKSRYFNTIDFWILVYPELMNPLGLLT